MRCDARAGRMQGSVLVQAVIAISLIVIVLIGVELGYLFHLKRDMQKAVDLAALAGAQALPAGATDCAAASSAAIANAARNLPASLALTASDISCGRWDPATQPAPRYFGPATGGLPLNAVSIAMSRTPALLLPALPGNSPRTIVVQALAAQRLPRAALTLRTTLASVDSTRSALLNSLFGQLLGGAVNVGAVGWNGLISGQIQLLGYLDQLALNLGLGAGQYDAVLDSQVTAGVLLQAAVTALQRQGDTAQATIDALSAIQVAATVASAQPLIRIGDLLGVQTGTPAAGMALNLQLFQLAQGLVQLANGQNGLVATVPISVAGLVNVTTQVKVIEPPQISAVGDPRLASLDPTGPDRIGVRSAQVRTLVTVELPVLSGVTGLTNAIAKATAPLLSTLNSLLSLKLGDALACLVVCTNQEVASVNLLPAPLRIDINFDAGGGESHVTDYSCPVGAASSLTAATRTAIAELRIGSMGTSVADASAKVFAGAAAPTVAPLPLVDISSQTCTKAILGLLASCGPTKHFYGGGVGLQADVAVGASTATQVFPSPPAIGQPPLFESVSSQNIIDSIGQTLQANSGLLHALPATGNPNGSTPGVLASIANTLSSVLGLLGNVVSGVLSPLLDATLNSLLHDLLGLDLAETDVGAQLDCTQGAQLVY